MRRPCRPCALPRPRPPRKACKYDCHHGSRPYEPYKDAYDTPDGVGDGRPTALQVLIDNCFVGTYAGKVVLTTGGTNGIGLETARALRANEADVYFTAHSAEKAEKVRRVIFAKSQGKGKLEVVRMDMNSLESVRSAAKSFCRGAASSTSSLIMPASSTHKLKSRVVCVSVTTGGVSKGDKSVLTG
ncbi:NAD(P)-binding protein [Phaeosphaeriaceae sp. SRC1lsM3a]|nr:NAD(P)-binding protein [Stagonospora sp. SRC1lsM3a]